MNDTITDESYRSPELQRRIAMREAKKMPCCPICGSECYEEVRKFNGILAPGGGYQVLYHACSNCSVIFKDPIKFFKKHGEEIK